MIQLAKDCFHVAVCAVIQNRKSIKRNQAGAIHAKTYNFPGVPLAGRQHYQNDRTHDGAQRANQVTNTIEFFSFNH